MDDMATIGVTNSMHRFALQWKHVCCFNVLIELTSTIKGKFCWRQHADFFPRA